MGAPPAGFQSGSFATVAPEADYFRSGIFCFQGGDIGGTIVHDDDIGQVCANFSDHAPNERSFVVARNHGDALMGPIHESDKHNLPWPARQRQFRFILSARMVASEPGLCYD
jgi:hypothetical protein